MVFYKSMGLGIGGWFCAAQFVKFTGMADSATRWSNIALYGVSLPIGGGIIFATKLLGIPAKDAFRSISLGTAIALILDGLATVLVPRLYTYEQRTPIEALAAIAYGSGWGIFAGYYVTSKGSYGF